MQSPKNPVSENSISGTLIRGSTRDNHNSHMSNKRLCIPRIFRVLQCGFLPASFLGKSGHFGGIGGSWGRFENGRWTAAA